MNAHAFFAVECILNIRILDVARVLVVFAIVNEDKIPLDENKLVHLVDLVREQKQESVHVVSWRMRVRPLRDSSKT
jgi:hypothetical protein